MFISSAHKIFPVVFCFTLSLTVAAETTNIPPKVQQEIVKITKFASDQTLIQAVRTQNQKLVSLDEILRLDRDWIRETIPQDFVKSLMVNRCALKLKDLAKAIPSSMEAFVMDNQGALVCMTQKTSDYWQGDEPKWIDSFKDGVGATVLSKREYDESTKSTLLHVSVPIMEQQKAIGVLCVGINLTKLAEETTE